MTYGYDNAPTDPHHGGKLTAEMAEAEISRLREHVEELELQNRALRDAFSLADKMTRFLSARGMYGEFVDWDMGQFCGGKQ